MKLTPYFKCVPGGISKLKMEKENLKGISSSHAACSKCPARKALMASLGHKGTKTPIISMLSGFCRCQIGLLRC